MKYVIIHSIIHNWDTYHNDYISFLMHLPAFHPSLVNASLGAYLSIFSLKDTENKKESKTPCYMVKHFTWFFRGWVFLEIVFLDHIILLLQSPCQLSGAF